MKQGITESFAFPLRGLEASDSSRDVLTEVLREGAQQMLGQAIQDGSCRIPGRKI